MKDWKKMASLVSHGARYQVRIAVILIAIVPLLSFCFVAVTIFLNLGTYTVFSRILISVLAFVNALAGYAILRKYPENAVRLRHYLSNMAAGQLSEEVSLLKSEDDISAIEEYLNMILAEMKNKVNSLEDQLALSRKMSDIIESQAKEILQAERHRVMIQSVGAACHHIGQPTTVLLGHVELLMRQAKSDEAREEINKCAEAVNAIVEVLDKLRHVSEFRTVPYQTFHIEGGEHEDVEILDIEQKQDSPADG